MQELTETSLIRYFQLAVQGAHLDSRIDLNAGQSILGCQGLNLAQSKRY
jgi:hypothetical protein